jgi:hypothetical protein
MPSPIVPFTLTIPALPDISRRTHFHSPIPTNPSFSLYGRGGKSKLKFIRMYLVLIGRNGLDLKSVGSRLSTINGSFPSYGDTSMQVYGRCPNTNSVNLNFAHYSGRASLTQISLSIDMSYSLFLEHSNSYILNQVSSFLRLTKFYAALHTRTNVISWT